MGSIRLILTVADLNNTAIQVKQKLLPEVLYVTERNTLYYNERLCTIVLYFTCLLNYHYIASFSLWVQVSLTKTSREAGLEDEQVFPALLQACFLRLQVADEKSCMQFSIRPNLPSTETHPEENMYKRLDVSTWLKHLNETGQVEEEYKLRKVRLLTSGYRLNLHFFFCCWNLESVSLEDLSFGTGAEVVKRFLMRKHV